jgi:hypothetical protein
MNDDGLDRYKEYCLKIMRDYNIENPKLMSSSASSHSTTHTPVYEFIEAEEMMV